MQPPPRSEAPMRFAALERHVARDVGRNTARMAAGAAGGLDRAVAQLVSRQQPHAAIVTGFYIAAGAPPAAETDGPPGAVVLGELLEQSGIPAVLVTDTLCGPPLRAAAAGTSLPVHVVEPDAVDDLVADLQAASITDVIFVERPGPAADGNVYDMRGKSITELVAPLHLLALQGPWETIGIGDGGNEVGMGSVSADVIASSVGQGEKVRCTVGCDTLIFGGVSNWAAIALGAAVATALGADVDITPAALVKRHADVLRSAVEAGAVDGVTHQNACTVDGLDESEHTTVLEAIATELGQVRRRQPLGPA